MSVNGSEPTWEQCAEENRRVCRRRDELLLPRKMFRHTDCLESWESWIGMEKGNPRASHCGRGLTVQLIAPFCTVRADMAHLL
jgi:hypothetical protein